MAADIKSLTRGDSSKQSDLRIVLLGNSDEKNKVIKSFQSCKHLKEEEVGLCTIYKCEEADKRIIVVAAPEWDIPLIKETPEKIKEDLDRCVSLYPRVPHNFLLLIPVRSSLSSELDSALQIIKSLPERVWRHTIILFLCDKEVEEQMVEKHKHRAEEILAKCGERYVVLYRENPQIHELFQEIDDLEEENHGDVFIPQTYYDLIQQKTKESSDKTELGQRRGSLEKNPPRMNEDKGDSDGKKEIMKALNHKFLEFAEIICMYLNQFIILMGIIGALLGSANGCVYGVSGSFIGTVVGFVVGVLLGVLTAHFLIWVLLKPQG